MRSVFRKPTIAALIAAAVVAPSSAFAQGKAHIETPVFDALPSPELNVGKNKSFRPKDWLEIEAKLKIPAQNAEQKKVGYLDEVVVKWYVVVKNQEGKGFWLLTKDITHVNVPVEEDIYSSCYLSPNTLKRITGSDRAGKASVDRVGIEVIVNGVKAGEQSTQGQPGWWGISSPSISRTDKFPLLDKYETPFKLLWWDRYAEIKEKP